MTGIELARRVENMERCEALAREYLRRAAKERLCGGGEARRLIPDEDFVAKGDIWVAPRRVVEREKRALKKIRKEYTSLFANRRKKWKHAAAQKLKIDD